MKLLDKLNRLFLHPYRWALIFSAWLTLSFSFVLLDTFVIPRPEVSTTSNAAIAEEVSSESQYLEEIISSSSEVSELNEQSMSETESNVRESAITAQDTEYDPEHAQDLEVTPTQSANTPSSEPVITATSYEDQNISISIETLRRHDTDIYVANIRLTDASLLKTAFAQDTYGRNIKDTTSAIAASQNALFAVNGDNYGSREAGFVLRNGTLYRDSARTPTDDDALMIDTNGDFHVIQETESTAETVAGAWQVMTFGPALLKHGELIVDGSSEVTYSPHSRTANPRTAIGQTSPLNYIIIVTDGRTNASKGLTLLELGELFAEYGCETAYNLDGGGSSTMVLMGNIVNRPTTSGRSSGERKINDIVYVGYE